MVAVLVHQLAYGCWIEEVRSEDWWQWWWTHEQPEAAPVLVRWVASSALGGACWLLTWTVETRGQALGTVGVLVVAVLSASALQRRLLVARWAPEEPRDLRWERGLARVRDRQADRPVPGVSPAPSRPDAGWPAP